MISEEELSKITWEDLKQIYLGGTGRMFSITINGKDYIFKPDEKKYTHERERFRGLVQDSASKIQKIVDEESYVPCIYFENEYLSGSIQPFYSLNETAPRYYQVQNDSQFDLTQNEINQFLREFITDYLLCNFDAHGNNFITDSNGIIRGIDKEQCFRYINSNHDYFDIYDNPNDMYGEKETIYSYLFKRYIHKSLDIDFSVLDVYINKINSISDEDYIQIFKDYIESRKTKIETSKLTELILERKRNLRNRIYEFITYLNEERNKSMGSR